MQDVRLQGTWRSDARRTGKEIDSWRDIPARRKRKLKALFGKLQLRFTRTRCYASLNGVNWVHRYKVLAKDEISVAILSEEPDTHPKISHIHFESTYFWINIGNSRLREFFGGWSSRQTSAFYRFRYNHLYPILKEIPLQQAEIGIMGGSGLYSMPGLTDVREVTVQTPFGEPSDAYVLGTLEGRKVAFLARHARGHRILPTEINFRANIYGMKDLGVERILSLSAVGSLKEEHKPTDFVIPDQFIDRTIHRISTFFGHGIVAHVAFGDPICPEAAAAFTQSCKDVGVVGKQGGTYICMEGPQFSTRAESNLYRSWGADVIGMTNLQEAKLCREAEICYSTCAMVTDYDCWHQSHENVTVEQVLKVVHENAENAAKVVKRAIAIMPKERKCACGSALKYAIQTDKDKIPAATRQKLALLLEKYLGKGTEAKA